jgi:hypothetical protein
LRGQIDRAAAIRVDEDGGESLRQQRLSVLQFLARQSAAGVLMHID